MTDIDEIRKKHEEWKRRWPTENEYIFDNLTISDVDALFKALDEARENIKQTLDYIESQGIHPVDRIIIRDKLKGGRDEI